jgi:hypothetical protein
VLLLQDVQRAAPHQERGATGEHGNTTLPTGDANDEDDEEMERTVSGNEKGTRVRAFKIRTTFPTVYFIPPTSLMR